MNDEWLMFEFTIINLIPFFDYSQKPVGHSFAVQTDIQI